MRLGLIRRTHFEETARQTRASDLQRRFASCQAAANDINLNHSFKDIR
jgi:hypothetical protein